MTMKTFTDIQLPDMSDAYRQVQDIAEKKAKKDYVKTLGEILRRSLVGKVTQQQQLR